MFCPQCGELAIPGPFRPIEGAGRSGVKALWRRVAGRMNRDRTRSLSPGIETVSPTFEAPIRDGLHSEGLLEPMSDDPRI